MQLKPAALKQGDTIGLIAPSGPVMDKTDVDLAAANLKQFGFKVKIFPGCYQKYGYLAGSDDIRAQDVNAAFADDGVDGIVCLKGGYGTPRILDRIDYDMIKSHPKIFAGYSDITGLHAALNKFCGFPTFHAPMPTELKNGKDKFTWDGWYRALTSVEPLGVLFNPPGEKIKTLVGGETIGKIEGGNLSLVAATVGTPYELDTEGRLLLLEDVGEEPYRLDRMLTQLRLAGKFEDCAGIVLGDFHECDAENKDKSLTIAELLSDVVASAGKPTICNLKTGHCSQKVTVPLGVNAKLNADDGILEIIESAAV